MIAFRDRRAAETGVDLRVHINPDGLRDGIGPISHGSAVHTDVMKTQGLKQALAQYGFDAAIGGARRDEEKSRAKERVFSFRSAQHRWDPKAQRPELWNLYNTRLAPGESLRVFPISNWTELDVWLYIWREKIPVVPLYFAAVRPVVERDGALIQVDDERLPLAPGEAPQQRRVRFRTLGCYPLTGAIDSDADTLEAVIAEMLASRTSERQGRVIDATAARRWRRRSRKGISDVDVLHRHRRLPARHEAKGLLRFITCGSVDDGKSTLIGRLLYDSKQLYDDQLASLATDSTRFGTQNGEIDYALLLDGLEAEREQGITIDVAYRFFSTEKRSFIVADCPGHAQYTRNMATGASTADLAVVLVDARKGLLTQTRRHSYIVSLLGIRHVCWR
jgi:sulfate adenylyltransferase subunit 2